LAVQLNNTHDKDDVKVVTLAIVTTNTALTANQEAIYLMAIDGACKATRGHTDGLQTDGLAPIAE